MRQLRRYPVCKGTLVTFRMELFAMTMKTLLLILSLSVFALMCNRRVVIQELPPGSRPIVSLKMELTSKNQMVLADSLLQWVGNRLQVYADEYHRFRLASKSDSADIVLRIQINGLRTISSDSLSNLEKKRAKLQKQVSAEIAKAEKDAPARTAAENVAANVVANLITMPFGFASIIMISGEVDEGAMEEKALSSTYPTALVRYNVFLNTGSKVVWKHDNVKTFNFRDRASELDQIRLLVRNMIIDLEDNIPILKPDWTYRITKE
jgi:hypothetical protein